MPYKPSFILPAISISIVILLGIGAANLWSYHSHRQTLTELLAKAEKVQNSDPERAFELLEAARSLALRLDAPFEQAQSYYWLARLKHDHSRFDNQNSRPALRYIEQSVLLFQQEQEPYWLARSRLLLNGIWLLSLRNDLGSTQQHELRAKLWNQLDSIENSIETMPESGHQNNIRLGLLKNRGVMLSLMNQSDIDSLERAISYFEQGVLLAKASDNFEEQAILHRLIGNTTTDICEKLPPGTPRATTMLTYGQDNLGSSIQIFQMLSDTNALVNAMNKLGDLLTESYIKNTDDSTFYSALDIYRKAYKMSRKQLQADFFYDFGYLFHARAGVLADNQKREIQAMVDSATLYYEKAILPAIRKANPSLLNEVIKLWSSICSYSESCARKSQLERMIRTELSSNAAQIEAQVQQALGSDKLDRTIQQFSTRSRSMTWLFGIAGAFLILIIALFYERLRFKHLQTELLQSIKIAQTKMNPHFVSNALNSIDWLITNDNSEEGRDKASDYLVKFSRLASATLHNADLTKVSLRAEIDMLKNYIDLERLRLSEKFEYKITIPDDMPLNSIMIPPMLLQPIVENAIWHGLQHKINSDKEIGELSVAFEYNNDDKQLLICSVQDNGIGRDRAKNMQKKINGTDDTSRPHSTSIIMDRLNLMNYSRESILVIHDLFDEKQRPIGTLVELTIPIIH